LQRARVLLGRFVFLAPADPGRPIRARALRGGGSANQNEPGAFGPYAPPVGGSPG